MDDFLIDDSTRESVLNKWNGKKDDKLIDQPAFPDTETPASEEIEKDQPEIKPKEKPPVSRNKIKKDSRIEWDEENHLILSEKDATPNISSPGKAQNEEEPLPEESKPIGKVGKRVRKVIKNVQPKQDQDFTPEKIKVITSSMDSNLSPYTLWLKSLKGSEYVHPYEDDYGLDQMSAASRGGVSETFADLLASQGYKDQAREMYMQLMEKYPEKSSFFAAKIEALT